jgi:hypothetical protein
MKIKMAKDKKFRDQLVKNAVQRQSLASTSGTAYVSNQVFVLKEDRFPLSKGDEVRLVGNAPHHMGDHISPGWVTVTQKDSNPVDYIGVLENLLEVM